MPELEGLPTLNVSGAYGFSMGAPANTIKQINNNYSPSDTFSKSAGRHTLKFGGEYHKIQVNEYNASTPNGSFGFDGTETGNAFAAVAARP